MRHYDEDEDEVPPVARDVRIEAAALPGVMASGRWPTNFEAEMSDHGPLTTILSVPCELR